MAEDGASGRSDAHIWIITGVPGAGKTTTARRLGERLARSAVIHGDDVSDLIVGGHLRPEDEPDEEAELQLNLSVENQALLARSFYDAGFTPIIEWIVTSTDRLWRYRAILEERPVRFAVLDPGESVSVARHRRRGKYVADQWVHMHDSFERIRDLGLWIDNGGQSVDEVVELLISAGDQALLDFKVIPRGDMS